MALHGPLATSKDSNVKRYAINQIDSIQNTSSQGMHSLSHQLRDFTAQLGPPFPPHPTCLLLCSCNISASCTARATYACSSARMGSPRKSSWARPGPWVGQGKERGGDHHVPVRNHHELDFGPGWGRVEERGSETGTESDIQQAVAESDIQ